LGSLASSIRLNKYVQQLGANQDEIETFISNLANSSEPEKLIDVANEIAQISMSESISLEELGNHINQREKEKQMLEEEINQRHAILENTNIDIQILNEYKKLKQELSAHGFVFFFLIVSPYCTIKTKISKYGLGCIQQYITIFFFVITMLFTIAMSRRIKGFGRALQILE
jgi:hypothetical protein